MNSLRGLSIDQERWLPSSSKSSAMSLMSPSVWRNLNLQTVLSNREWESDDILLLCEVAVRTCMNWAAVIPCSMFLVWAVALGLAGVCVCVLVYKCRNVLLICHIWQAYSSADTHTHTHTHTRWLTLPHTHTGWLWWQVACNIIICPL